ILMLDPGVTTYSATHTYVLNSPPASPAIGAVRRAATLPTTQPFTVTLNVSDSSGASSQSSSLIQVKDVAPTATFGNDGDVQEGDTATVSFTDPTSPSTSDLLYSYDFNNDGAFEISNSLSPTATVPASFLDDGPGTRIVHGRIADTLGAYTDYTTTIT